MGRAKGRVRQSRRLVDMSSTAEVVEDLHCEGLAGPGDDEDPFVMPLRDDVFALVRLRSEGPQLASFALMLFVRRDGDEHEVARVDSAHGTVHLHVFQLGGREESRREIRDIHRVEDIERGYDEAFSAIVDDHEDLIRRWNRGH